MSDKTELSVFDKKLAAYDKSIKEIKAAIELKVAPERKQIEQVELKKTIVKELKYEFEHGEPPPTAPVKEHWAAKKKRIAEEAAKAK